MRIKKIASLVMSTILMFSLTACTQGTDSGNDRSVVDNLTRDDFSVWSINSYQKVLSTQEEEYYASKKTDGINLVSAKNDYESGQIILSAKKDLFFTVEVSDLVNVANPSNIISKDNFEIFTQLYISVSRNLHGNSQPIGLYPDAILPQENAVEFGKNEIKKGFNGGAWIEFYIPTEAEAGNYSGTATVTVGKNIVEVPVSLKVYNVVINEETTSKSQFTINGNFLTCYELDNSTEMQIKYEDLLLEHRLSPTSFAHHGEASKIATDFYEAHKKGASTIGLSGAEFSFLQQEIIESSKVALQNNDNFISKMVYYDYIIDEPFYVTYANGRVEERVKGFHEMLLDSVEQLNRLSEFNTDLGKEIIKSVGEIVYIVTDYNTDGYGNAHRYTQPIRDAEGNLYHYPDYVSICPKPDGYSSEEERATYRNGAELWWYNCNEPSYPYPGYHIDDTMTSHCVMGWMQAEYDIVGNIYWCCNYFADGTKLMENPYLTAQSITGANGEGAIIYPGKMFNVDGPVSSLRLEAIRDGQEDYELIKALKDIYSKNGQDASKIIKRITSSVYTDSSVIGNENDYETAREILLSVLEVASSSSEVMFADIQQKETQQGKLFTFDIVTADGTELYSDNVKLTKDGNIYHIEKTLNQPKNYLSLKAVYGGEESFVNLYLGGQEVVYRASLMEFDDYAISGNIQSAVYDSKNQCYKMTLNGTDKNDIIYKHASINDISESTSIYKINLYNYSSEDVNYKVYIKYSGLGKVMYASSTLKPGNNELIFDSFPTVNWANNKSISEITITFIGGSEIGIGDIAVYGV